MKRSHVFFLVLIIAAIAVLISLLPYGESTAMSSYETVYTAKEKEGKFVHLVAKLDTRQPVEYDALKNPNYLSFTAIDSLGATVKIVYYNAKPDNLEQSERLVMKGRMKGEQFECKEILMKCPSKYTDDPNRIEQSVINNTN